jgi:hypothetical protein
MSIIHRSAVQSDDTFAPRCGANLRDDKLTTDEDEVSCVWCRDGIPLTLPTMPARLTVEWVCERVAAVKADAGDDESAHILEDRLHEAVLQAIAEDRCDSPALCAAEALKTEDIEFSRWYA